MVAHKLSTRRNALGSYFLYVVGLLALGSSLARAQNTGDWETAPGLTYGQWDNGHNDSGGSDQTWQIYTNGAWLPENGKVPAVDFPSNNVGAITILGGVVITNATGTSGLIVDGLVVASAATLTINKATLTLAHNGNTNVNGNTNIDMDIFGNLGLQNTTGGGSFVLSNNATIVVENGGTMTNFSGTSSDNFAGPGYINGSSYVPGAITFLNGSSYVQTGSKGGAIPSATWATGSTCLIAPLSTDTSDAFPGNFTNQTFYNFIWNWPTQPGQSGNTDNAGNVTVNGNFSVINASNQVIEDIPGPGFTMIVNNVGITNATWYPTGSAGTATVEVGGNFFVDSSANIRINSASGLGNMIFDGSSPQTVAINGTNLSAEFFHWTVASGSTVNMNSGFSLTAGTGVLTNNGTLNLTAIGSLLGTATNFIAPGATLNVSTNTGFTLAANQTLFGGGTIIGNVAAATSSIIHPGSGRTLTFANSLAFNGATATNIFDLTSSVSSGDDQIVLNGNGSTLTCDGAQIVINSDGPLATSDYVLFNVTGAGSGISGSFNATPSWSGSPPADTNAYIITNSATQVLLHYTGATVPQPHLTGISLSGTTNVVINGTNGIAGTYVVLMSTNLATTNWTPVATNTLSGSGSFSFTATNAVKPGDSHQFYILKAP